MVVCALSHENLELGVFGGEGFEIVTYLLLAHCGRQVVFALEDEFGRHIRIEVIKT